MQSARTQATPDPSRRPRGADNEATTSARARPRVVGNEETRTVRSRDPHRRIVPAAFSAFSASAYVHFGNIDVECKNAAGFDSWPNEMSEVQRPSQCFVTAVKAKSSLNSQVRRPSLESFSLGPYLATKASASRKLLSACLWHTQTG